MNSEGSLNSYLDGSVEENEHMYLSDDCIKSIKDITNFKEKEIRRFHSAFLVTNLFYYEISESKFHHVF
jgi:hypothetical protein